MRAPVSREAEESAAISAIGELELAVQYFCSTEGTESILLSDRSVKLFFEVIRILDLFRSNPSLLELNCQKIARDLVCHFERLFLIDSKPTKQDFASLSESFIEFSFSYLHKPVPGYTIGDAPSGMTLALSRILYTLCTVTSPKVLLSAFSQDSELLLPATYKFMVCMMHNDYTHAWEASYVLTLLISTIIQMPIALENYHTALLDSLIAICRFQLRTGINSKGTANLLAAILRRPDAQHAIGHVFRWLLADSHDSEGVAYAESARLYCAARLLKVVPSAWISNEADFFVCFIERFLRRDHSMGIVSIKFLVQAIRFLANTKHEDQLFLQNTVQILIDSLSNASSSIRLTAAKSISVMTEIFSESQHILVFSKIKNLFLQSNPRSWHGGIVALALIIENRSQKEYFGVFLVSLIAKGLAFDSHKKECMRDAITVRDATCFLLWVIARHQPQNIIEVAFSSLAANILFQACFDRECIVRRAASAAYQEIVGRRVSNQDEVEVIHICNYFSVANRTSAFTIIARQLVKQCPWLSCKFIHQLVHCTIFHSDNAVRKLSACALGEILELNSHFIAPTLQFLVRKCSSLLYEHRHGALLAITSIISCSFNEHFRIFWEERRGCIQSIVSLSSITALYLAKNTKSTREYAVAVCNFLCALSEATYMCPIILDELLVLKTKYNHRRLFLDILLQQILSVNLDVADAAARALKTFLHSFYCGKEDFTSQGKLMALWMTKIREPPIANHRRGYIRILENTPKDFFRVRQHEVIEVLIKCLNDRISLIDPHSKEYAVQALSNISCANAETLSINELSKVMDVFFHGFKDLTADFLDGCNMRRECAFGFVHLLQKLARAHKISEDTYKSFMAIIQEAFGYMIAFSLDKKHSLQREAHVILLLTIDAVENLLKESDLLLYSHLYIPAEILCKVKHHHERHSDALFDIAPLLNLLNWDQYCSTIEAFVLCFRGPNEFMRSRSSEVIRKYLDTSPLSLTRLMKAMLQILLRRARKSFTFTASCFHMFEALYSDGHTLLHMHEKFSYALLGAMRDHGRKNILYAMEMLEVLGIFLASRNPNACIFALEIALEILAWNTFPTLRHRVAMSIKSNIAYLVKYAISNVSVQEITLLLLIPWFSDDITGRRILHSAQRKLLDIFQYSRSHPQHQARIALAL